jgi:hypothetical protein
MDDMLTTEYDGCGRCLVGVRRLSRKTDATSSPQRQGDQIFFNSAFFCAAGYPDLLPGPRPQRGVRRRGPGAFRARRSREPGTRSPEWFRPCRVSGGTDPRPLLDAGAGADRGPGLPAAVAACPLHSAFNRRHAGRERG